MEESNKRWLSPNFISRCISTARRDASLTQENLQNTSQSTEYHHSPSGSIQDRCESISLIQNLQFSLSDEYQDEDEANGSTQSLPSSTQNSINKYYGEQSDCTSCSDLSFLTYQDEDNISIPSLYSEDPTANDSIDKDEEHDEMYVTSEDDQLTSNSKDASYLDDKLPKSFLQLQGLSVGNYNMACNYHISAALKIMVTHKLHILTIQEHTAWSRELTQGEITSMKKLCDKYQFTITISKLQIVIMDKVLAASHRGTEIFEDGRIIKCQLEIASQQYANLVTVYGIPHHGNGKYHVNNSETTEDETLAKLHRIRTHLRKIINLATTNKEDIYVFGDLQDTPDNKKNFNYGTCRIPKHPLGITKTFEDSNLSCTAYKHLDSLNKPVISRHGMKGGRFIDGMYACNQGLQKVMGISITSDTRINSDHLLVVSKIDLGIETHNPRDKQEERIDFRRILNIPVRIIPGNTHPSLDDTVYKGADYKIHAALFHNIQKIVANPSEFHDRIQKVHDQLRTLIQNIVGRTKNSITIEEQKQGKLITRTNDDAKTLNDASMEFFSIIYDICRKAELSYKAYSTKMNTANRNQEKIASEKIMLTATSYALSKQLDETAKRQ